MRFAQCGLGGFAGDFHRLEVNEENMAFGAAGDDAQAAFDEFFRHCRGIGFDLFGVFFKLGL